MIRGNTSSGLVKFRNVCWYTNIEHGRRHQPLQLMSERDNIKYSKHKEVRDVGYQRYENYDAIEVPFTDAIPSDYEGMMGVPISFLDKYCPEQFEILGHMDSHGKVPKGIPDEAPYLNGKWVYSRILIRHRRKDKAGIRKDGI